MSGPSPAPEPNPQPAPASASSSNPHPVIGKVFLVVATALFVGWMSWLGYTALTKSHAPTVSHAQAAAASFPVKAELTTGQAEKPAPVVKVLEQLTPNGPATETMITVRNLPACSGYAGPGEYLLLLNRDTEATIEGKPSFVVAGQQRSPGGLEEGTGPPRIYPWSVEVEKQVQWLYRR